MGYFFMSLLRNIVRWIARPLFSALAGYAAMAFVIAATFGLAYLVLGADGAFAEGTWAVSGIWVAMSIVVGLGAATLGGWVCRRVAGGTLMAPALLVAAVLLLGYSQVSPTQEPADPAPRTHEPGMQEAMRTARQPTWLMYLNPILGVVGVVLGSGLVNGRPRDEEG